MSGRALRPRRETVYTDPNPDLDAEPAEPRREGLRARSQRLVEYQEGGPSTSRPRQRSGAAAAAGGAGDGGGQAVPQRGGPRGAPGGNAGTSGPARSPQGASTMDIMRGLRALESLENPTDDPLDSPPRSAEGGPSSAVRLRSPERKAVGWAAIPVEMLERVLRVLLSGTSHQRAQTRRRISGALRAVCTIWRRIHDALLTSLYVLPPTPDAGVRVLARRFANVIALDFKGEYTFQPQVTDVGLLAVSQSLPALTSLNLTYCVNVTDEGMSSVARLSALVTLNLMQCFKITDDGLRNIQQLPSLTTLSVRLCRKVTSAGMDHVSQLPSLTSLNLSHCSNITDDGLRALTGILGLNFLDLRHCPKLTEEGVQWMRRVDPSLKLEHHLY